MSTEFGARLRLVSGPETTCDGELSVYRWVFDPARMDLPELARTVGRAYVTADMMLAYPQARLSDKVPQSASVRKGDFGELIAQGLYSTRMGREVPFTKLQLAKPVSNATVQGPDTLCLTIDQGESVEPVIVEAKARTSSSPSQVLDPIAGSFGGVSEEYCIEGWAAGVQMMRAHPDYRREFAFTAAQHLGRLTDPDAALPPHLRHAVVVVPQDRLTLMKIKERWSDSPPVCQLHVVVVPDLLDTINALFEAASRLTYADLTRGASILLDPAKPGVAGLLSPDVAASYAGDTPFKSVIEASLWYLADEDGIALARARAAAGSSVPDVRGLAELLTGALKKAQSSLSGRPLVEFAEHAACVLDLREPADTLLTAISAAPLDNATADAARHVAAALIHRLDRHPLTMVTAQGSSGDAVLHVVAQMRRFGRHAFWPSQAAAVRGGLLDRAQRSLAIKMPTSAGKTTLMQLVAADAFDHHPDCVVAVLAPTRALVRQLAQDMRNGLPEAIDVRSSQGGLDYDLETPSQGGVFEGPGVAVTTPERLDLDWRRAVTGDEPGILDDIKLLIVDEAQHIDNGVRGATLERLIAKALRRGIRVVLLASQFSNVHAIANWINGDALESDWRPAWLERHVYTRGPEGAKPTGTTQAYLWSEGADALPLFPLKSSAKTKTDGCVRDRPFEAAALVKAYAPDGLVVAFTEIKRYAPNLLEAITSELPEDPTPPPALLSIASQLQQAHPAEAAALRQGVGLHHGEVHPEVRRAIETAARKDGGLLRCIVCTPTLLEGVDFPARTVIAAYPPHNSQRAPDIARLRNLEGRAGRAGKFTSGRLVVMTSDFAQARKWRRAMRQALPPTQTALTRALRELQRRTPEQMEAQDRDVIDALTIEALAESAAVDGDLRRSLEQALERTFWWATTAPAPNVSPALSNGAAYAASLSAVVPDGTMRAAIYRSGLKLRGCLQLRDALAAYVDEVTNVLRATPPDSELNDALHLRMIRSCIACLEELKDLRDLDEESLSNALTAWIAGDDEKDITDRYPEVWESLRPGHLDTMLPWACTGALEIVAALANDPALRDAGHDRLAPSRIRYGTFDASLCYLVRDGADRVQVSALGRKYLAEAAGADRLFMPMDTVVAIELMELDAELNSVNAGNDD